MSLNNCNAQHRKQKNTQKKTALKNKKINPYQYLVTKDFEKINFSKGDYTKTLQNGNFIEVKDFGNDVYHNEYIKNTYYLIRKGYYPNGNIEFKGISFNQDTFKMGIWYEFDENGKLIKETNYDDGYDFTLKEVIQYAESLKTIQRYEDLNNEVFPKGEYTVLNMGDHNRIKKDIRNGQKVWVIECHEEDIPGEREKPIIENGKVVGNAIMLIYTEIVLDGKTGKVLSKKIIGEENLSKNEVRKRSNTSFLASPEEKGTSQKAELGVAYSSNNELTADKNIYQIYDGRYYTKAEWEEFQKSLPWWKRIL
ncbi:hypothetical protein ACM39_18500 [Chryseobacterium sp. FH2]|nr:hypothetical protein ACM39_18500 [Chryseobacterium sp. FH2]